MTQNKENFYKDWECPFCKKKFLRRDFVELHWKNKHMDESTPCLSDLCDIFECKRYPDSTLKNTAYN